jgi:hypothetical protein
MSNRNDAIAVSGYLKIDRLLDLAFFPGRAPRSVEYREGCAAALEYRILGAPIHCRHAAGSTAADAWYAGVEEGHSIWRAKAAAPAPDLSTPESALLRAWHAMDDRARDLILRHSITKSQSNPRRESPALRIVS